VVGLHEYWIADGHNDSVIKYQAGECDLRKPDGYGHWYLEGAEKAALGLQIMAMYIESEYKPFQASWRGLQLIESALDFIEANRRKLIPINKKRDLSKLGGSRIGILISVEGGEILGESLFMLDIIYRLGVRALGLTWNQRNAIADGVGEEYSKNGLSLFGRRVIAEMNNLGMLIDLSHLNEPGFWDVLQLSNKPVVASHSCAHALCNHPRNLSDEQLRALAEAGGMVGINFCPDFLRQTGQAKIDDVIRHICHIAEVAGVDSVGFGSDFDGITSTPEGLENVEKFNCLREMLEKSGFNREEMAKICHVILSGFWKKFSKRDQLINIFNIREWVNNSIR